MSEWTETTHILAKLAYEEGVDADNIKWALGKALVEIERLQPELVKALDAAKAAIDLCDTYSERIKEFESISRRALDHASKATAGQGYLQVQQNMNEGGTYPPNLMWQGGQPPKEA